MDEILVDLERSKVAYEKAKKEFSEMNQLVAVRRPFPCGNI